MSLDAVALCTRHPDLPAVLHALRATDGDLGVEPVERGGLVRLRAPDGRILVTIEGPSLVQVPTEAARLLDPKLAITDPIWWVETRAHHHDEHAVDTARRLTEALVEATGGTTWFST